MILHLVETRQGLIFEPHGEEPGAWHCDAEGGDILRAAGWRPYEMHRVSRFVYNKLLTAGQLKVLYDLRDNPPRPLFFLSLLHICRLRRSG